MLTGLSGAVHFSCNHSHKIDRVVDDPVNLWTTTKRVRILDTFYKN
jgi:hypothetical protein